MKKINFSKMLSALRFSAEENNNSVTTRAKYHWRFALFVCVLALVLSLILHYSYYLGSDAAAGPSTEIGAPTLDKKGLLEISQQFQLRQSKYETLLASQPHFVDPD